MAQLKMSAGLQKMSENELASLSGVTKRWHTLHTLVSTQLRKCQKQHLKNKKDIIGRLDEWRKYLSGLENDFSSNIANTLGELLEQQKLLEVVFSSNF